MPAIMLLAAVLAAERVSFVLVGSAGLHLHGQRIRVHDSDAVPAPGSENLAKLHHQYEQMRARLTRLEDAIRRDQRRN